MKKILFVTALVCATLQLNAQTTIFEEDFESTPSFQLPPDWQTISTGGSFNTWFTINYSFTDSYGFSGNILQVGVNNTAGNYGGTLKTETISIPAGQFSYTLTYLIGKSSFTATDVNYAVYVLPADELFTGTGTQIPVFLDTFSINATAFQKTIDLSAYAGQDIRLYFQTRQSNQANIFFDSVKIIQKPLLATSDIAKTDNVKIYPNPVSDILYIQPVSGITQAEIFDITGKKVNSKLNNNKIDVKNLQSGIYILSTEAGGKKSSQKFIKK
ncbi:T9SS type A sorting domain-containing protein [Epilithonimonas pallida]|uniref:Por secretion system C-terminal sorting domain-containing protein n=1 Tax=Epilithonimonas pallida TaxID=373671 RepID=A0ABY1R2G5_9FLAO|nr:T9SS type A sorting domain-containing protein [Epilithonimonas pallida]SMP92475.1 Por secretion system C-terminal sorting domain-containing protein [Epilithonimonas pallida]